MIMPILVSGLILGLLLRFALKYVHNSYGFANDLENTPVFIKACVHCNARIRRDYKKNLCPSCGRPVE